jgi:hypothetical protein
MLSNMSVLELATDVGGRTVMTMKSINVSIDTALLFELQSQARNADTGWPNYTHQPHKVAFSPFNAGPRRQWQFGSVTVEL